MHSLQAAAEMCLEMYLESDLERSVYCAVCDEKSVLTWQRCVVALLQVAGITVNANGFEVVRGSRKKKIMME